MTVWHDRTDAGQKLAQALGKYKGPSTIVYGLPRGGVVLASEVAKELEAKLSLIIPRKIGHPNHSEYAIGAVTENSEPVLNDKEIFGLDKTWLNNEINAQKSEAKRRRLIYLAGEQPINPKGKTTILVDDGIATGYTMTAAIRELKTKSPAKIIVAVPVAPADTVAEIEESVGEVICLKKVKFGFMAVGQYYKNFEQVTDEEVMAIFSGTNP